MNIEKIREHYEHAKEKHPYFCDKLNYYTKKGADNDLSFYREFLKIGIEDESVAVRDVLACELAEMHREIVYGNTAAAVEECYDAIAVLLRVVDVLEGRQALGDPAKKGGAK